MKYPRVDATHFSQFLAPTRALCSIAPTEFGQSDRTRKLIRLLDFKAKSKKTGGYLNGGGHGSRWPESCSYSGRD